MCFVHSLTWALQSNERTNKTSYKIVYSKTTILITWQHYYKFTGGRAIVTAHPPLDHRWFNGRRGLSRPPIPVSQKCRNHRFVWRHGKSSGFSRSIEECSQGKNTTFTLETYASYAKYTLLICRMCISMIIKIFFFFYHYYSPSSCLLPISLERLMEAVWDTGQSKSLQTPSQMRSAR